MDNLKKLRKELDDLKRLISSFISRLDFVPPFMLSADPYSFLDDIEYLREYLDCMIRVG